MLVDIAAGEQTDIVVPIVITMIGTLGTKAPNTTTSHVDL